MGKLRTHEDKTVADLAKETVKKWKNDVAAQKEKPGATGGSTGEGARQNPVAQKTGTAKATSSTVPTKVGSAMNVTGTNGIAETHSSNATANGTATPAGKNRDATSDGIAKYLTEDKVRNGSITLLYNAIVLESTERRIPLPAKNFPPFNLSSSPFSPSAQFILLIPLLLIPSLSLISVLAPDLLIHLLSSTFL